MKKVLYSPDAVEKIRSIERKVRLELGNETAQRVKETIVSRIRSLGDMEYQGVSMYEMYGVTPDYYRLFVAHNYVFYLIEEDRILVVNLYHEKEDHMYRLFGIRSVSDDSEAYWDEVERDDAE